MNPLAVSLQVARSAGDLTTPAGDTVDFSGTLLHEQHHWLQQLGTPAGIFNLLLLETQASYVMSTVDAPALTADDLPIADSPRIAPEHLDVWLRLEATRILFFGGRADDLQVLQDAGHPPLVGMLTQLLWPMVRRMPPSPVDTPEPNGPLRAWAINQPVAAPPEATIHWRYLVGASHLMEGAARTGELAFTSYTRRGALDAAWVASNLTGQYKVIWDMLTENDPPTTGRIAQLLYICDLGMCGALPPAFPPTGPFMHPAWAPGKHASTLIKLIRQLAPPADVDFASPDSMRAAIATFDQQLSPTGLIDLRDQTLQRLEEILDGYTADAEANNAFRMDEDIPAPNGQGSRFRYILALACKVLDMRRRDPLLLIAPFVLARADPAGYTNTFATIAPPLIDVDGHGYTATHPRRGWTEYFLMGAVEYELVRALMTRTFNDTVRLLAPYAQTRAGPEHGAGWVAAGLHHSLRGSELAASLSRAVWRHAVEPS